MQLLDAGLWGMAGGAAIEVLQLYQAVKTNKNFPWNLQGELRLGLYVFCTGARLVLGIFVAVLLADVNPLGPAGAVTAGISAIKILEQLGRNSSLTNTAITGTAQETPPADDAKAAERSLSEHVELPPTVEMAADDD
jgi:hypothetical protein